MCVSLWIPLLSDIDTPTELAVRVIIRRQEKCQRQVHEVIVREEKEADAIGINENIL